MSYQEQRALLAFLSTLAVNALYLLLMLPVQPSGDPTHRKSSTSGGASSWC